MEGEGLLRPGGHDDFQELIEAAAALLEGHIESLVDIGESAPADAQLDPAVADVVEGRHLFRHANGVAQGQAVNGSPNTHGAGSGGDRRGDHHRGRQDPLHVEVVLGEPNRCYAKVFGLLDQPERLGKGVVVVAVNGPWKLEKESELHACPPRSG